MTSGPDKPLKRAFRTAKREVKEFIRQRKIKRYMEGKEKENNKNKSTPSSSSQDDVLLSSQKTRQQKKMEREVNRARKKDTRQKNREELVEKVRKRFEGIGEGIGEKVEDLRTKMAQNRYKKGKGPRGERATESGSATDEQVCGPDGKCTTKRPKGL